MMIAHEDKKLISQSGVFFGRKNTRYVGLVDGLAIYFIPPSPVRLSSDQILAVPIGGERDSSRSHGSLPAISISIPSSYAVS